MIWHQIQSAAKRLSCGIPRLSKCFIEEIFSDVFQNCRDYYTVAVDGMAFHLLVFTMAIVVIIKVSKWVVGGEKVESGHHLTLMGRT